MKRIFLISMLLVLIIGTVLSGCSKSVTVTNTVTNTSTVTNTGTISTTKTTSTTTAEDKYGGVLKITPLAGPTLPASYGVPWNIRHGDRACSFLVMELLIRRGQEPGMYEGRLAERWELAPDKSYYTFYLRKGVKFHDGTDFNAEAVKWNFEMAKAAKLPQFNDITSIEAIDTHTVRLNISKWNSEFLHNIASDTDAALILSPTAYQTHGEEWCNTHPVGTGPFMFKDYKSNQYLFLEKNPDYWEEGVPYLDEVQIYCVPDMVTLMAALKSGDLDLSMVDFLSASQLKDTKGIDVWVDFKALGAALSFNMKNPESVWSDKRMREALEYAIDKEKICKTLTYGFCEPVYEVIRGVHGAGDPGTTPRLFDPDKAKQLMAEAGHEQLSGIKIEYSINDKNSYGDAYLAVQKNLADVGIQVELSPLEGAAFNEASFLPAEGNNLRIDTVRGDPLFPFVRVIEDLAENTIYFPGAERPEGFGDLIEQALVAEDPAQVLDLTMQMERLVYESVMYVSLWSRPLVFAKRSEVHDAAYIYGGIPDPIYYRTWIEK